MINLCCDKPPEAIKICGAEHPIRTDFLIWIKVQSLMRQLDGTGDDIAAKQNFDVIAKIINLVFEDPEQVVLNCSADDILTEVEKFLKGYDHPKSESDYTDRIDQKDIVSFEYDLDYIIIAIRNQTGLDLSYKRKESFHWWLFLLEFETLEEQHYISRLMSRRAYSGNDKELIAIRENSKIPEAFTITRTQQRENEQFNSYFK